MAENKEAVSQRRGRFFAYAPLFLWAVVILVLGSGPGSSAQTSRIIKPIIEFFFPGAAPDTFLLVHAFIRKSAHFIEYAVLGLLAVRAFRRSASPTLRRHWAGFAFLTVVMIAGIDEFNQSFNISRTGSGWDVLLDLAGAVSAILICVAVVVRKWAAARREERRGE